VALPFTLKNILRQKKKNYGNSNISPYTDTTFKKSFKKPKILQDIITFMINLKLQHKPKNHVSKIPHVKIDLLLPRGQNPLSDYCHNPSLGLATKAMP